MLLWPVNVKSTAGTYMNGDKWIMNGCRMREDSTIKTSDPPEAGEEMLKTTPVFRFWPVTVDPRPGHQLFETFPFSSENHVLKTICTLHYNAVRPPIEDRFHSLFNSQEIFQTSRLGSHLERPSLLLKDIGRPRSTSNLGSQTPWLLTDNDYIKIDALSLVPNNCLPLIWSWGVSGRGWKPSLTVSPGGRTKNQTIDVEKRIVIIHSLCNQHMSHFCLPQYPHQKLAAGICLFR